MPRRMISNCPYSNYIIQHLQNKFFLFEKHNNCLRLYLDNYGVSIYSSCDILFLISEQLPAASVTQRFTNAKTVRNKPSRWRKNSPLTRFASIYVTFLLAFSRVTIRVTCANYRRENQYPCARYPGAGRTNKNSFRTLPYFRTVSTTVNLARRILPSLEIQRIAQRECGFIWSKTKSWGKISSKEFPAHANALANKVRYFFACKVLLRLKQTINYLFE